MSPLYLCLAAMIVLAIGPVIGFNDHCKALSKCSQLSEKVVKDEVDNALCMKFKKNLDCLIEHVDLCDYKAAADAFKSSIPVMKKTVENCGRKEKGSLPKTEEVSEECFNLTSCFPVKLPTGNVDKETACREIPKMMECFNTGKDACDSEKVKEGHMNNMQAFKKMCNESGKSSASLIIVLISVCAVLILQGLTRSMA
ncbi:hypothetical protein RRG08_006985 [Elysia crispata]|uniref:Uncharacterized protein n=1 Tax=Elysia crispata TaxID=231223 RepID=A0AAE1DSS4_9GAST|nr:hypothetical protein RRG08_006985 [Elysia crispata]